MTQRTQEHELARESFYEPPAADVEDHIDSVVLPTGEVIEDTQQFLWRDTLHEISINGSEINFIRDPEKPHLAQQLTHIHFKTHDEFRDWCIEEQDDLQFLEQEQSIWEKFLAGLRTYLLS